MKLTGKQENFCQEYLIDCNATQAAIRAGYSEKTAYAIGEQNLRKLEIKNRLDELRQPLQEATKLSQQWVLNRFKEISDRCMTAEPVMIYDGENWVNSGEYKFDSAGANKATEQIGKHLGFYETDNKQKAIAAPVINILPQSK